ncbi:hypothetical protein ACS0TY_010418 [Phlomoides rotata]
MGKEKAKKKGKGLWSPDEDQRLRDYVVKNGHACWSSLPMDAGLQRNGKSCRLRWINYLRPGLKRGAFSIAEVDTILTLHHILGNKWSQIAHHLPGRSDNEIKNYWHSCLKKRVAETTRIGEIGGLQVRTPGSCSSESLEQRKGSVVDKDQSLPKVLFAEWLSFDQFYNQNNVQTHEDILVGGLLQNGGGTFGVETNPKCSQVYVDDMLNLPSKLDYFPGEL